MPRADDLPDVEVDLLEIPCATNPLGVKGAGEAGAVGSPSGIDQRDHRCAERGWGDRDRYAGDPGTGVAGAGGGVMCRQDKGSTSFLQKRSKKLLSIFLSG